MKVEFALVFAELQRQLQTAQDSGNATKAAAKMMADASSSEVRHASPKVVTSATANLEEIPSPEKITAGDRSLLSPSERLPLTWHFDPPNAMNVRYWPLAVDRLVRPHESRVGDEAEER